MAGRNIPETFWGYRRENGRVGIRNHVVILPLDDWKAMERRLAEAGVEFVLSPRVSFQGKPAEQHIMMLPDGCGNVVEFKSQPRDRVFATE